jgi:hypothetical protein
MGGIPIDYDSISLAYLYKEQNRDREANQILNKIRISFEEQLSINSRPYSPWLSSIHAILDEKEESLKYLSDVVDSILWMSWTDFALNCPFYEKL